MAKSFREESRSEFVPTLGQISSEQIKTGALQRLADAAEKMAVNFSQIIKDRDQYKRWYEEESQNCEKLERRVAALQGVITKMKKAIPQKQ